MFTVLSPKVEGCKAACQWCLQASTGAMLEVSPKMTSCLALLNDISFDFELLHH